MSIPYKQDMPPAGGYKGIQIKRLPTWSPKCKNKTNFKIYIF